MHRLVFGLLPLLVGSCSLFNSPDDIETGSGGSGASSPSSSNGASGAGSPSAGGSGGTGGDVVPVCNNGVVEGDEACDDGNDESDDACSPECEILQFDVEVDASLGNEFPGIGTSGVDGGKGFFVVWRWLGPQNEIRGRAYTGSGKRVTDNAVKLSQGTLPGQARIGTNTDGRSIVSWHGEAADSYVVHYRVVTPDGTPDGADQIIAGSATQFGDVISVGASDSGDFALVWLQPDGGTGREAWVRAFDAMGVAAPLSELLGASPNFSYPGIWGVKDGFVASWGTLGGNLGSWKLNPQGAKQSPPGEFELATDGSDANPNQSPFGAYVGPQDQFIAVYESYKIIGGVGKNRILKRNFTAPGQSAELGSVVSSVHRFEYNSRVARHSSGRFIVVWAEGETDPEVPDNLGRVKARVFESDGQAVAPEFKVSNDVKGTQSWPGVAVNSDGDVMFVWDNWSGDEPIPTGGNPYKISSKIYPRLMVK